MASTITLKTPNQVLGASRTSFAAGELASSFRQMAIARAATSSAPVRLTTEMSRRCQFTDKKANNGYAVTFSHKRNKKLQQVNLQEKRIFWESENRWVKVKVAASTIKTIQKIGLEAMAKRCDIDLYSLPYSDISPARTEWLKENNTPPKKKNKRAMKQDKATTESA